jgi:hypothetical protein
MAQEIILRAGIEVAGDYLTQKKNKITKKNVRDETEPMISLVANDNWAEYTLRYVVDYKKKRDYKNYIVF